MTKTAPQKTPNQVRTENKSRESSSARLEKRQGLYADLRREGLLFLFSFVYALSLSMLFAGLLRMPLPALDIVLITLCTLLILTICFFNTTSSLITLIVVLLFSVLALLTPFKKNDFFVQFSAPFSSGMTEAIQFVKSFLKQGFSFLTGPHTPEQTSAFVFLAKLTVVCLSTLNYILIQKIRSYWLPFVLFILMIPVTIAGHAKGGLSLWLIPLGITSFVLLLMSSGHLLDLLQKKNGSKQLATAAAQLFIALALALAIAIPLTGKIHYQQIYSPYWQGIVDDLITLLPQSLQPKLTIAPFSLGDDGYYPLGNRLGGKVELKDLPAAKVKGNIPTLLKVQASDFYDGLRWQRILNNPNFRYSSPFNGGSETHVFNPYAREEFFKYLPANSQEKIYQNFAYDLTPLRDSTQLLFTSGTPTKITSSREEALLFYFNQAGLLYAKTHFNNQNPYHVESYAVDTQMMGFDPKAASVDLSLSQLSKAAKQFQAEKSQLPNQENAYKNYLQTPKNPSYQPGGNLYQQANQLVAKADSDYLKIQLLLHYFRENPEFKYSLDVATPPENQDFIEHFLSTKVGYCTYYASAMTMFSRLAGVPARYVEGYALTSEEVTESQAGKEVRLTSQNAHAWTEVYLTGLGWVAVDPTPGGLQGANLKDPEPTPSPTPSPTPIPTTATPTTSSDPKTTTTPTTGLSTTPTTSKAPDQTKNTNVLKILGQIFLVVLILAILIALAWFYYKKRKSHIENIHNRSWLKDHLPSANARASFYWKELLHLNQKLIRYYPTAQMTEREIAEYLAAMTQAPPVIPDKSGLDSELHLPLLENWPELAQITAMSRYAKAEVTEDQLLTMANAFDQLENTYAETLGKAAYIRTRILPPSEGKI